MKYPVARRFKFSETYVRLLDIYWYREKASMYNFVLVIWLLFKIERKEGFSLPL
jgi:hypothetical protein